MSHIWNNYRFLIMRRSTQIIIFILYFGANAWGWNILSGNLSSSLILDTIPLSDPYAVLQMLVAGVAITMDLIIGILIVILFYMSIGGRAFCSWVCPINMVTDFAGMLREKIGLNKIEGTKKPLQRTSRYWILGLSLVVSFVMGATAFEYVSPISILSRGIIFGFGVGLTAILGIFIFDLFVLKNGWCGHLCPLGGFYSLIGKYSLLKVHHYEEECTLCMKCKVVCPESQVLHMIGKKSLPISSGECTNCSRCIEVCDDDALGFSLVSLNKNKKNRSVI